MVCLKASVVYAARPVYVVIGQNQPGRAVHKADLNSSIPSVVATHKLVELRVAVYEKL